MVNDKKLGKNPQIAAAFIFSAKKIGKKRRQGFFSVKHSIKSGRRDFFGEKTPSDVEYSIFQHLKLFPTTLEISFEPNKYQPPGWTQFFVKLRVIDHNFSNVL
jgi:hypothetical protein